MILGFGHKARQGKDTAAEAVVEYYNNRRQKTLQYYAYPENLDVLFPEARQFRFADELYRICREEYGMVEKDAPLLQKIGDGRRVQYGQDYWIKLLEPKIKEFKGISVISDMRYINEAEFVKSLGGHTINVRRINEDGNPFITSDRDPNFISEIQLDNYNYDHYIISKYAALTAEQAITIAEFVRGLNGN